MEGLGISGVGPRKCPHAQTEIINHTGPKENSYFLSGSTSGSTTVIPGLTYSVSSGSSSVSSAYIPSVTAADSVPTHGAVFELPLGQITKAEPYDDTFCRRTLTAASDYTAWMDMWSAFLQVVFSGDEELCGRSMACGYMDRCTVVCGLNQQITETSAAAGPEESELFSAQPEEVPAQSDPVDPDPVPPEPEAESESSSEPSGGTGKNKQKPNR